MGKRSRETAEQERTPKKRKKPKKLEPQDGEELGLPVVEELDEISLQLREEKRKALKILDSMVTDGNEGGKVTQKAMNYFAECAMSAPLIRITGMLVMSLDRAQLHLLYSYTFYAIFSFSSDIILKVRLTLEILHGRSVLVL